MFDPAFLKLSKEMDVVRVAAFTIVFLAPLAAAAPVEVPAVQKFHEAMINSDNGDGWASPLPKSGGRGPQSYVEIGRRQELL